MPRIGDTLRRQFRVVNPSNSGANVDADALPTAVLRRNGVTVGAATVTVTKISTGYYDCAVLVDAAHGWDDTADPPDVVSMEASYEVGGVAITRPLGGGTIRPATVNAYRHDGTEIGTSTYAGGAVASVTDPVTVATASKTGYALSTAGVDAIWDRADGIESGITPRQAMRAVAAALAGILSGADGTTITLKAIGAVADGTTRIVATVDSNGNRSAITLTV